MARAPEDAVSGRWPRPLVAVLDSLDRRGGALAVRLVKYTGKSPEAVHPKHLLDTAWHHWYVDYLKPDDVVLDLGCGNGAHTLAAAGRARRVYGLDADVGQLAVAAATADRRRLDNVALAAWDITRPLPFPDATFDAVLFLDVIEHLEPRVAVLREIRRVLRPEGRLLLSAPHRETSWRRRLRAAGRFAYSDADHKVEYSRESLLSELASGGFAPSEPIMPVVYDTPFAGLIDVVGGVALGPYARLVRWKRAAALRHPEESIGFRVVAHPQQFSAA
jgi:SAM-dependent methyltransferase